MAESLVEALPPAPTQSQKHGRRQCPSGSFRNGPLDGARPAGRL